MLCNIHRCVLTSIISHQTSLFILNHLNFMYQAKEFGAETLFIPYFSSLCPPSHSPCPPGVCSHHNFSVRASFAERELLKWATLRQYKLAFQELFTKSFVTALILTGSTWLKSFVHSYCIWSKYQLQRRKRNQHTGSWKVAILLHFRLLRHFHAAIKIHNFWPSAEQLFKYPQHHRQGILRLLVVACIPCIVHALLNVASDCASSSGTWSAGVYM